MSYRLPEVEELQLFASAVVKDVGVLGLQENGFKQEVKIAYLDEQSIIQSSIPLNYLNDYVACVEKCGRIWINRIIVREDRYSMGLLRAVILHEIGHMKTIRDHASAISKELRAQLWCLEFAARNGMETELAWLLYLLYFDWKKWKHTYHGAYVLGKRAHLI